MPTPALLLPKGTLAPSPAFLPPSLLLPPRSPPSFSSVPILAGQGRFLSPVGEGGPSRPLFLPFFSKKKKGKRADRPKSNALPLRYGAAPFFEIDPRRTKAANSKRLT